MAPNGVSESPVDVSAATTAMNLQATSDLVKQLAAGIDALTAGGGKDDTLRQDLSIKARDLMLSLETPRETSIKHIWAETGATGAISWGVDCGLWKQIARNGDRPQSVQELASQVGVDSLLLARLLRHLAACGFITETGPDEYKPTNFTKSLSLDIIGDAYIALPSSSGGGQLKFHEFNRKRGWKNPTDAHDTSLQYAHNTDKDLFAYLQGLGYGQHFNNHMRGYRQGRLPWMAPGFFPVKERLIDGLDMSEDPVLLVDIGGSVGHDLEEFTKYHGDAPGKLILQDLPAVITEIKDLNPRITPMEYDFHTEQPVKGARAYYLHSCLHDWPDSVCESILSRVKAAMKPGYSKLLINENVIPSTGAWWESSALDMTMLMLFSAKERTEADWYDLIERAAGLKIVKIWSGGRGVESLIEVELP
ncbi:unnamed protein product [Clonostachys rosea f. rosea IK726]|uniref:O-methyltransferase C-terminal domain-containing protein n=2 Tax=Bionectria ochroleuca TaxID=29856 RepID=A0A0B7KLJ6_BIOOC|nr:unnamed protein product [Clonostachys rosea f. rosea IK726]